MPFLQVVVNGTNYKLTEIFFVERWTIPAIGPILAGVLFALLHHGNHFQVQKRFTGPRAGFLPLFIFLSPLYLPDFLMPMVPLFHGLGAAMVLLWITRNQSHAFVNAMEWKPIKYVGTISYGLYIWQGFFLRTGPGVLPKIWVHDSPQNVLLAIVVSILSYELLEKKVLRWKSKFQPA
jgi:peptidoglycan/LPS O-acetylase OafA/YrhL